MKILALAWLLVRLGLGRCPAPLFYSKYFKGSIPEYVAITVERDGQVTYQEAKEDDNPIRCQLTSADNAGDIRSGRQAGPFPASHGIRPQDGEHGREDISFRRRRGASRDPIQLFRKT